MNMDDEQRIAINSLLSRDVVLRHMEKGTIIIDPFKPENLGTASYDVSLGKHYFREQDLGHLRDIYSPYSEMDVKEVWGRPLKADFAERVFGLLGRTVPEGISNEDEVILIGPGETILAHTEEFIGGQRTVTTMMKARSSMGRNFISVCKCAGWGDVGYVNRWTMEITNNSTHFTIPLVAGRRIAQIAFFQVDSFGGTQYGQEGKYQTGVDLTEIRKKWLPHQMLPKMWKDREVTQSVERPS